jgi:hypothetical protein
MRKIVAIVGGGLILLTSSVFGQTLPHTTSILKGDGTGGAAAATSADVAALGQLTNDVNNVNQNSQNTNNVIEAAAFPGSNCGSKILAAITAFNNSPKTINVSQACGMTIQDNVILQPGQHLKFTEGGTWTVSGIGSYGWLNSGLYMSDNTSIEGVGPQVIIQTAPVAGGPSGLTGISISPGTLNNNSAKHATVRNLTMDCNADGWYAFNGGSGGGNCIDIQGANDTVTDGVSDITLDHIWFKNTAGAGLVIAATTEAPVTDPHDIHADYLNFDQGYAFDIHLGIGVRNVTFDHTTIHNFMKPFAIPITSAVSSDGTHITLTTVLPIPNDFQVVNGGFIYVKDCADPKYDVVKVIGAPSQLDSTNPDGTTTLQYHNLTGGAGASTTGCTVTLQNAQAPIREELSPTNTSSAVTFDHTEGYNDYQAQEFFFEIYGDILYNSHILNSILDANGSIGGNSISMKFQDGSIENNNLKNGAGGQLGNGCECGGSGNIYKGNHINSGALMAGLGNNVIIADNSFTGCQVNGSILTNSLTNFSITGNSINNSCATNGSGIVLGWEGGNVPINSGVVANNTITMGGVLNAGITLGGDSTSTSLTIAHNIVRNAGFGITVFNNSDGSYPTLGNITLSKNDFSNVATQPVSLGGTANVIFDDNIFPSIAKVDTESQTGLTVYDHINLLLMVAVGTGSSVVVGGGSGTSWVYTCVGYDAAGNNTAPINIGTSDNATLSSTTHSHFINCPYFKGATGTKMWRIAGGTGFVAGKVVDVGNPAGGYYDTTGTAIIDTTTPPLSASGAFTITVNGTPGVSVNGTSCTVKAIVNGIITSATCP